MADPPFSLEKCFTKSFKYNYLFPFCGVPGNFMLNFKESVKFERITFENPLYDQQKNNLALSCFKIQYFLN